ncbi:hypothetical protein PIB30_079976 [Stylosanthes scabra]|uniref:Uncharacterized protein n=1 Tax=Stylosanthes scabra TaxID=79078 RepID=A0ABU6UQ47_9FABA|nr:hypothetical protein [Stylosanthes scabra]
MVAVTSTPELRLTHHLRLREALITLYVSIPPLRYGYHVFLSVLPLQICTRFELWVFLCFRGSCRFKSVLARARAMNHHPHGRMKVLWAWLKAMEGVDGAIASLRMHEE